MSAPRLSVRRLSKAFGAHVVLRDLDLTLAAGEIHALIGGNGAGKSTLSKIIAGLLARDTGELHLDSAAYAPRDRRAAQAAGVVMVLQELNVLPTLTVAENLFLGALPARAGLLHRGELHTAAREALDRVGLTHLAPDQSAGALGLGQQQLVEIAAALAHECRLLILDEPTAALTAAEIHTLFELLRGLRAAGTTILYISHRLDELPGLVDQVSVLRDGQLVATAPITEAPRARLVGWMAGATAVSTTPAQQQRSPATDRAASPALRVRDVRGVDLDLHAGEIVGLGGLVGAGRTRLLRAIYGAEPMRHGALWLGDHPTPFRPQTPADAVAHGFAFVPEDRKQHGLLLPLSVQLNATLPQVPQRPPGSGWIDTPADATAARALCTRLHVHHHSLAQPVAELSGGNQQKLVFGRWLPSGARFWLLDEPTRGVDLAARAAIYDLLRALAADGAALLVASSDFEELVTLCDRVLVLSQGVLTGEFTAATLSPAAFLHAALAGFSPAASATA